MNDKLPEFMPPGPGEWKIIDHIAQPGTRVFSEYYYEPMEAGWNCDARRIGAINRVKIREVNGFMYYQMNAVESKQEFLEMCSIAENYWIEKNFLRDLKLWDDAIKPSSIKQLRALQEVELHALATSELIEHLSRCLEAAKSMTFNHHQFTYTSFVPIGDFIRQVSDWTGKKPIDILRLLQGSDNSRLLVAHELSKVQRFIDCLKNNADAIKLLAGAEGNDPESAARILSDLESLEGDIKDGLQFFREYCEYRIISGYDITYETFTERPDLMLKSLRSLLNQGLYSHRTASQDEINAISDLVPLKERAMYDEMVCDARRMERLRDERGMFSDLWAIGILRCAYLEAGKRLFNAGLIDAPKLALDASFKEISSLLEGRPIVTSNELQQRAEYRMRFSVTDAPVVLKGPQLKPQKMPDLSAPLARIMSGLEVAINLAVEHSTDQLSPQNRLKSGSIGRLTRRRKVKLKGISASIGIAEGTAKVISSGTKIKDISKGDIIVMHQATASFAIVFPLIAGIILEYGGILSHPAILAREFGIPCIVGCSGAMEKIHTGNNIRLDGAKGIVEVI